MCVGMSASSFSLVYHILDCISSKEELDGPLPQLTGKTDHSLLGIYFYYIAAVTYIQHF